MNDTPAAPASGPHAAVPATPGALPRFQPRGLPNHPSTGPKAAKRVLRPRSTKVRRNVEDDEW